MAYETVGDRTIHYAGFWIRFVAYFIDSIILGAALGLLARFVLGIDNLDVEQPFSVSETLIGLVLQGIYFVSMWVRFGASIGKMAVGIIIVQADDYGRITVGQAVGRFFGQFLSAIPLLLGFIWAAFDPRKQTWHDKLAGTVVIYRD